VLELSLIFSCCLLGLFDRDSSGTLGASLSDSEFIKLL
jgi:hypothetical protein